MNNIINVIIWLLVLVIALSIIWYILQNAPFPPILKQWATMIIVVLGGIFLIMLLLSIGGGGPLPRFGSMVPGEFAFPRALPTSA